MISWAGMRGIVSLAAALALPPAFPYRDLIVLIAFSVVVGTLVLQGLTLKPLLRALDLHDDDPVGRELGTARERALRAGLASLERDRSPVAEAVRQEFAVHLASAGGRGRAPAYAPHTRRSPRGSSGGAAGGARHARPTKSATTPFIRSKRNWTGSKWQTEGRRSDAPRLPFGATRQARWGGVWQRPPGSAYCVMSPLSENASRSALIVSASVVGMPCGKPL